MRQLHEQRVFTATTLRHVDYLALDLIDREEATTSGGLAGAMSLTRAYISNLVTHLSNAGWLEKRLSAQDGRVWHLHLTPAGSQVLERTNALCRELDAELCLSPGERMFLAELLRRVSGGRGDL